MVQPQHITISIFLKYPWKFQGNLNDFPWEEHTHKLHRQCGHMNEWKYERIEWIKYSDQNCNSPNILITNVIMIIINYDNYYQQINWNARYYFWKNSDIDQPNQKYIRYLLKLMTSFI